MAPLEPNFLTRDTYHEWMEKIQGFAEQLEVWKFVSPNGEAVLSETEPKMPLMTDYKKDVLLFRDLSDSDKEEYTAARIQYSMDLQAYKQNQIIIGNLRNTIWDALHPNYRGLITSKMNCREALITIRDYLRPEIDELVHQLTIDIAMASIVPPIQEVESWLMEWERIEITAKRLNRHVIAGTLSFTFGPVAEILLPKWEKEGWKTIWSPEAWNTNHEFSTVLRIFRGLWRNTQKLGCEKTNDL